MAILSSGVRTLAVCFLGVTLLPAQSPAVYRGGSNFNIVNGPKCYPDSDKYGAIVNYDVATATVDSALQTIYSNGQRSLRFNVYHTNGGENCSGSFGSRGYNMNSSGGALSAQCYQNIKNVLTSAKNKGFQRIQISFHPQGINYPLSWPSNWVNQSQYVNLFFDNWNFINDVRAAVLEALNGSSVTYRFDLMNEGGTVDDPNSAQYQYSYALWNNWRSAYGKANTVGFSIAARSTYSEIVGIVNAMAGLYSYDLPTVFEYHVGEKIQYLDFANALLNAGYSQPWIIGEAAHYDDSASADDYSAAYSQVKAANPAHSVLFLLQWPSPRTGSCSLPGELPQHTPISFTNYINHGY